MRKRLARLRRALLPQYYGKFCLSVSPAVSEATKKLKQRSNCPGTLLELLQRVLRVSAAEYVRIDGGVWKRRTVSALPVAFQRSEAKSGHVGTLCICTADFADAHTTTFEVMNFYKRSRNISVKKEPYSTAHTSVRYGMWYGACSVRIRIPDSTEYVELLCWEGHFDAVRRLLRRLSRASE